MKAVTAGRGTRTLQVAAVLAVGLFALGACNDSSELSELEMPETSVLSLRAGWGVVTGAYTRVHTAPEREAEIQAHVRRTTVVEITDKSTFTETLNQQTASWYQVRTGDVEGWVFGSALELYNSEQQARNAANTLGNR